MLKVQGANEPLISVIIPVYKVEDYLSTAVESVMRQTYKNLEIILVDDGSPDGCPLMCESFALHDSRVKVLHKTNGGLSSARNEGIKVSNGDYIAFVDSDDWISDNMYEILKSYFDKYEMVGVVSSMITSVYEGNESHYRKDWIIKEDRLIPHYEYAKVMISEKASHPVWNKLFRADILKKCSFKDGRLNEDMLFEYELSKIMEKEKLCLIEIPYNLYYYRKRSDSICSSTKKPFNIDIIQNLIEIQEDCRINNPELFNIVYDKYVKHVTGFCIQIMNNSVWKENYYHKYYQLVKSIPTSYFLKNKSLKESIYFVLLKYTPKFRFMIWKIVMHLKNE